MDAKKALLELTYVRNRQDKAVSWDTVDVQASEEHGVGCPKKCIGG